MKKVGSYEIELVNISPKQWRQFLKEHSNLPGPKENIELAEAFSHIGTLMDFKRYIAMDPEEAPENSPEEFLSFCGVLGYGQYLSKYHDSGLVHQLRMMANDPRPRIREAVVQALHVIGQRRMSRMIGYVKKWVDGTFMEQRAAIIALCNPGLPKSREIDTLRLELLDWVTATMVERDDQQDEGYELLKKALGDYWSVSVASHPEKGKPMMERWIKENHPVVNDIMVQNIKTDRLMGVDSEWAKKWLQKLLSH